MLYNYKEVLDKFGSDYKVRIALKNKSLFRLDNGIYSDIESVSNIEVVAKKYPNSVITSYSAYYLYDLIDEAPDKIYLASLRDSYRIKEENVVQSFVVSDLFSLGKVELSYNDSIINIYDKERMLIELIRNKKYMNSEVYNRIVLNYRKIADDGNLDYLKIFGYLKRFNNCDLLIESLKNEGFFVGKSLYQSYMFKIEEGMKFTKADLGYENLYQLSIVENMPDALIGNIFQMTKEQVRLERKKNKLENVFMRRQIDDIENVIKKIPNEEKLDELELYTLYIKSMKIFCDSKGWKFDTVLSYFIDKSDKLPILKEALKRAGYMVVDTYKVNFKNLNYLGKHKTTRTITSNGRKFNQSEINENKLQAGSLGETIAYDAEIRKLQELGYNDLLKDVKLVSKTDDKDITYDGLGYDLVSFNEKKEKIYIEVKCSTTINNPKVNFKISKNEVKFINGELPNIDKHHAFIYYVYNIDKSNLTADILIITHDMFKNYTLISEVYSVSEDYEEVN